MLLNTLRFITQFLIEILSNEGEDAYVYAQKHYYKLQTIQGAASNKNFLEEGGVCTSTI
jgi:hypothetical protein